MVVLEGYVFYVNLLVQVVLAAGVISWSAWGMWEHGVLFCIGWVAALGCCSRVFIAAVDFSLLLQAVSFMVVCFGGPGRLFCDSLRL